MTSGRDNTSNRQLDFLVIAVTAGIVLGLIWLARGTRFPMHSVNDLSRWATVYSLAERGTYQIDQTPWPLTIDRVQLNGHSYSSKPPLLPTLLAGEYWLMKKISLGRLNFDETPESVIRIIVITVNLVPLVIFLVLYSRLLNRWVSDAWTHLYCMMAAALGTYLTGYSVTLNNHTLAAFSCFFAMYPAYLIWCEGRREGSLFVTAGFFGGFTAVNEFPALAFLGVIGLGLMRISFRKVLLFFIPLALLPILGHLFTNYLVTGGWKPAYANKEAYDFPGSYWKIDPATGRMVGSKIDPATGRTELEIPEGIDNQYEPWHIYLFHMVIGHHGILSLSPIFVFTLLGWKRLFSGQGLRELVPEPEPLAIRDCSLGQPAMTQSAPGCTMVEGLLHAPGVLQGSFRFFGLLSMGVTILMFIFYLFFAGQRNYGGFCNGLRWLFWLIPSWLMFLPLGLEGNKSRHWFQGVALVFLLISAASAFYASRNPWTRSWLHQWLNYHQWIRY